jgi:hypothetical protein
MIRSLIVAAALAAAACSDPAPVAEPEPDPDAGAQVGDAGDLPRTLPPLGETPRYVGLWAASAEGCDEPAWRFEAERVTTRGEISCTFNEVSITPTGYQMDATCYAEGPPTPHTIQVSFSESARAMMTAGAPWAATGLVYCAPLPEP